MGKNRKINGNETEIWCKGTEIVIQTVLNYSRMSKNNIVNIIRRLLIIYPTSASVNLHRAERYAKEIILGLF